MQASKGFTLIEIITVIIIMSILAGTVVGIIRMPVESYLDLQRRNTMLDNVESALNMMQRDIRRALPNSVRITNSGAVLEILHTTDGGRYRAYPDNSGNGNILNFAIQDSGFDVIGSLSAAPTGYLVVYNLGEYPANAYAGNNIASLGPTSTATEIVLNPAFQFPLPSPQQRFYIVDTPITYGCDLVGGNLLRYANYSITATQAYPPSGATAEIQAGSVSACSFTYSPGTASHDGLVTINITLTNSGESSNLIHQIHVDNAS